MGFLMEALAGPHPDIEDVEICRDAVAKLHALGIAHRDLHRFNIVQHENIVKLLDLKWLPFEAVMITPRLRKKK